MMLDQHIDIIIITVIAYQQQQQRRQRETQTILCLRKSKPNCSCHFFYRTRPTVIDQWQLRLREYIRAKEHHFKHQLHFQADEFHVSVSDFVHTFVVCIPFRI